MKHILFFSNLIFMLCARGFSQQVYTADNGITASGSSTTRKVSLGGTLTGNTTIPFGGFNLNFSGTGNIGIRTTSPEAPLHVYKSVSGNYNPVLTLEDGLADGYVMFQMRGTGRRYNIGTGNASETFFGLANSWFVFDETAATPRMVVNSSGNVGIGLTNPSNRLSIAASAAGNSGLQFTQLTNASTATTGNGKVLGLDASGNVILVNDQGAGTSWALTGNASTSPGTNFVGTTDDQRLVFKTNGIERATFLGGDATTGGFFGLGTSNPLSTLHVNGTYTLSSPSYTGNLSIDLIANNTIRFIQWGSGAIGEFMRVGAGNYVDFVGQQVVSRQRGAWLATSITGGTALFVDNGKVQLNTVSGNTMIGTTTDDATNKLQVNGSIKATGLVLTTSPGAGKVLTSDANGVATWQTTTAATDVWKYGGNNVVGVSQIGNTSNEHLQLITNGDARMQISKEGYVGIGTLAIDAAYRLSVEGSVRARKVRVDATEWADYVFYPGYRLRPLHEVEKFIKDNSHLPDVPSAAKVEKEGIDLGDNQAVLLKKIEELTLYIIDQNKRLEEQEKRLKVLEKELSKKN